MLIGLGIGLPFASAISLAAQIAALFAAGEQGAWYDPSDWSTLFQDSAGTLPVTAVGQPVGKMLDKSGRGNHATQPTAINRPVLQQDGSGRYYLAFNGTNRSITPPIMLGTSLSSMVVAGIGVGEVGRDQGIYAERDGTGAGSINGQLDLSVTSARYVVRGAGGAVDPSGGAVIAVNDRLVLTGSYDGATANLRKNGALVQTAGGAVGAISVNSAGIGREDETAGGAAFFNGNIYGLIVRAAASNAAQIASAERYLNAKTGAY